mmetsp:Transcript_32097/g.96178  ORF Transcript_32097/g.96178 Transcript_32097/m.96178 type:complete len:105 (-) Transcript_32097:472-786(-)
MKLLALITVLLSLLAVSITADTIELKKCGVSVNVEKPKRQVKGHRELKRISFTVTRKGEKKKCRCNVSSISKCKRCGGRCCHDLGNGTQKCREEVRKKLCKKFF